MGTSWEWFDETKTIAVVTMSGDWARDNLKTFTESFWPQLRQQPHTVDMLVEIRGTLMIPTQPIVSLIWLAQNRPPNAGRVVFVVRRQMALAVIRALNHTLQQLYPNFHISAVLTREEAIHILTSSRETTEDPTTALAPADNQFPSESPQ